MKKEEKAKQNWEEDDSSGLDIETLTEIQGGIEDGTKDVPSLPSCGLGCFQGSGGVEDPTD